MSPWSWAQALSSGVNFRTLTHNIGIKIPILDGAMLHGSGAIFWKTNHAPH
jgi:hypothetical protein